MGTHPPHPPSLAGRPSRHPPPHPRPAPPHGRHPLRRPHRHPLALPPARLPTPPDRLRILRQKWETDGIFDQLTGLLRRLVREREGRDAHPSACVLDSQSVKTSANVHLAEGYDAAKKIAGRKRHIVTDTLGPLLTVLVTSAAVHDSTAGTHLLDQIAPRHPRVTKSWADSGYKNAAVEHAATRGIDLEVVHRTPGSHTFTVQPRRWVIERTLGWFVHHRRLARDYETHPHRSAAMIRVAAIDLMSRRVTQESTTNWRDT
ncbi:hypothetical protein SHO565_74110 [Streptomyces sp. HO565]